MRLLTHPEHGRVISLGGRIHPPPMGPHFKFANYHLSIPTPNYIDYSWDSGPSLDNVFGNDEAGNCLVGETEVGAANILNGMRAHYRGDVVTLVFTSGKQLTVTPNHAILTPRGFVVARLLHKGDDVVSSNLPQQMLRRLQPDLNKSPSIRQEKVSTLFPFTDSNVSVAMPMAFDLNGDQEFIDSNVDVVGASSFLHRELNTTPGKPYSKKKIGSRRQLHGLFHSDRAPLQGTPVSRSTSFGDVGGGRVGFLTSSAHSGVHQVLGLGVSSHGDPSFNKLNLKPSSTYARELFAENAHAHARLISNYGGRNIWNRMARIPHHSASRSLLSCHASDVKPSAQGSPTDAHLFSDLCERLSGLVATERLVEVYVKSFDGHIYDVGTESRWYTANGIISHNCTIAAAAHTEGVWTGNAGALFVPTLEEVFAMYSACEGPPGYPAADNGCDEITVLNYWVKKGLAGRKPAMWMTVDHTNMNDCRAALFLFENLYICAYLPDAWVDPFPAGNGFTWNVEGPPVMNNGHAWMAYGYDFRKIGSKAFKIDTWGMQGRLTAPALMKYTDPAPGTYGGLYSVLSWDIINRAQQRAPNGFNWQQLKSDFAAMS